MCASKPHATRDSYSQKARHLGRLLGTKQLDDLTRAQVERYIATRIADGAHTHTIHKELVVLRGALTSAEARGTFHGVIAKLVPRFKAKYTPRETYLTPAQFTALMAAIVATPHPNAKPETIAKIDLLPADRARVASSRRAGEAPVVGRRPRARHDPRAEGQDQGAHGADPPGAAALARSAPPIDRAVIEPWGNDKRELQRACERAGVPRVTPNDLRRTFATWLKQNDVDSAVVAAMMGHSSTAMVDKVYGKLDEATYRRAIAKLPAGDAQPILGQIRGVTPVQRRPRRRLANMAPMTKLQLVADSVEEPASYDADGVRAEGLEPWTRRSQNLNQHAILQ